MQYQLTDSDNVKRINEDGTTSWIPNDPGNRDWIAYQDWLAADEANIPLPADEG